MRQPTLAPYFIIKISNSTADHSLPWINAFGDILVYICLKYLIVMSFAKQLHAGYSRRIFNIDKKKTEDFIDSLFRFIFFLEYNGCADFSQIESRLDSFKVQFEEILRSAGDGAKMDSSLFFDTFPTVYKALEDDARYIFENDPAAQCVEEVKFSYPGFFAIAVYRLAHELVRHGVQLIPRIWTEYAHSKTGIDIHPGAEIG